MGNWYSTHVALWVCVLGWEGGRRRGGSHTAGMSSYLDQPVFTSPSAAAFCSSLSLKTRSRSPGATPVSLPRTSALAKKERMKLGVCEAGYLNASACVREIKVRKSYGFSFVCILEERE